MCSSGTCTHSMQLPSSAATNQTCRSRPRMRGGDYKLGKPKNFQVSLQRALWPQDQTLLSAAVSRFLQLVMGNMFGAIAKGNVLRGPDKYVFAIYYMGNCRFSFFEYTTFDVWSLGQSLERKVHSALIHRLVTIVAPFAASHEPCC